MTTATEQAVRGIPIAVAVLLQASGFREGLEGHVRSEVCRWPERYRRLYDGVYQFREGTP